MYRHDKGKMLALIFPCLFYVVNRNATICNGSFTLHTTNCLKPVSPLCSQPQNTFQTNSANEFLPEQVGLLGLLSWCLVHGGTAWPLVQISNSKTVVSEGADSPDQARQPQPATCSYCCKATPTSTKNVCEISGFCRGAVEGYFALQLDGWLLTFRDSLWSHI